MGNYFGNFFSTLGDADFIELTFYAVGLFIAIVITILVMRVVKGAVNRKVRKINYLAMDLGDLKKIRRTGLVSEEEYRRIKSLLIQRIMHQTIEEEQSSPEETKKPHPDLLSVDIEQPPILTPPPSDAKTPKAKPIDIEDLLKKGLISPEEYQQLASLSHRKPATK